ncbi:MAG: ROK family protein [bacterium]
MNLFVVDIGGTNLRIAVVNSEGDIIRKERYETPKDFIEISKIIEERYISLKEDYLLKELIGISIAGAIIKDKVWLPNISKDGFPLGTLLFNRLKIPIKILDDRISGVLGEYWKGKGRDRNIILYFIIGTGVGLGILIDGKVVYGRNGVSGSLGWIPLGKRNSYSSEIGTLESQIAGPAILREYNRISDKKLANTEEVFELFEKKDENAIKVISRVGRILGKTLSSLLNLFDPDIIILSGSIGLRWHTFKSWAYPVINLYISPLIKDNLEITISDLKEDAQILGVTYILLGERMP